MIARREQRGGANSHFAAIARQPREPGQGPVDLDESFDSHYSLTNSATSALNEETSTPLPDHDNIISNNRVSDESNYSAGEHPASNNRAGTTVVPVDNSNNNTSTRPSALVPENASVPYSVYEVDDEYSPLEKRQQIVFWLSTSCALLLSFTALMIGLTLFISQDIWQTVVLGKDPSSSAQKNQQLQQQLEDLLLYRTTPDSGVQIEWNRSAASAYWGHLQNSLMKCKSRSMQEEVGAEQYQQHQHSHELDPILIPGTPEYRALEWLVLHDPAAPLVEDFLDATITIFATSCSSGISTTPLGPSLGSDHKHKMKNLRRLEQRYALAVMYFTYSGDTVWPILANGGWPRDAHIQHLHKQLHQSATSASSDTENNDGSSPLISSPQSIHECKWSGVSCNAQGIVTGLNTTVDPGFYLYGTLPLDLCRLTDLKVLVLSHQAIQGSLPPCHWPNMKFLHLDANNLVDLTAGIRSLGSNLVSLRAGVNHLQMNIDESVWSTWTNLKYLGFADNKALVGNFWKMVSLFTNLEHLDVDRTHVGGTLPTKLGDLSQLTILSAVSSGVTGTLPTELANLRRLQSFRLGATFESSGSGGSLGRGGSIPSELAQSMTNLRVLFLIRMDLIGTLPENLGNFRALRELHLTENTFLSGTLPSSIGRLTNLQRLELKGTRFEGTVPSSIGSMTNLVNLDLRLTSFTGSMPREVCALRSSISADCLPDLRSGDIEFDCSCCTMCWCDNCFVGGH